MNNAETTDANMEQNTINENEQELAAPPVQDGEGRNANGAEEKSVDEAGFDSLLAYLKRSRSFDFSGYKRASLMRRVLKRINDVDVESFADYVDFLEVHPDEFSHLFNAILINVTSFFRDPAMWDYLGDTVLPRLLASRPSPDPIRVWSAGCASGAEAFTLAMMLAEALGFDEFRERVKIYATDVDDEALAESRQASYGPREVVGVPQRLLNTYFEQIGGRYYFHKELRRAVIFGRHDLLKDAPISRIDLLVCRNTLMYFNAETQAQVLQRLHFALSDDGYLFLGKAEMLFAHAHLFTALDLKRRIFSKVVRGIAGASGRDRLLAAALPGGNTASGMMPNGGLVRMREQAFDAGSVAQIVVELDGSLALVNERARQMFRVGQRDVGRVFQDLELSYRPVELRSRIEQAISERRTVDIKEVLWTGATSAESAYLDVQVMPLSEAGGGPILGISITFADVTRYTRLQQQLEESNRELETAYEELQSTNEELETTNEELQSTVEELETTNEELQSTNEELETMNEELQSTNEELQTLNEELQNRSSELNHTNAFMSSILGSLSGGVIVLDREMMVQIWNQKSEDFWGLRLDEVRNKNLLGLDIGLPTESLRASLRACLSGASAREEQMVMARNRRGRTFNCKVTCSPLISQNSDVLGVILLIEEAQSSVPTSVPMP